MRNITTECLILHAKLNGEYHKYLTVLSRELGLLQCTAYGAYKSKSKMVSSTDPYRHGRVSLYHNPVKNQYKVVDIEILDGYDAVRDDIRKIMAAGYCTEVVRKTYAGGNAETAFPLVHDFLHHLDMCSTNDVDYILLQFLARYLFDLGMFTTGVECSYCGRLLERTDDSYWTGTSGDFVCSSCNHPGDVHILPGTRVYLTQSVNLPFVKGVRIKVDNDTLLNSIRFIQITVEALIGKAPLTPWP